MTLAHPWLNRRAMIGLGLGIWVICVCVLTMRARVAGPHWGADLISTDDGRVIAVAVDVIGAAWDRGVRPGDEVISVDGADPHRFSDAELGASVRELIVRDASDRLRTVRVAE